jgi:hypothetical protein
MITIGRERREDQRPLEQRVETVSMPRAQWEGLISAAQAVVDNWETNRLAAAVHDLDGTLAELAPPRVTLT